MMAERLNLFYAEPDPDRWLPLDRIPRRIVRRLLRGPARPGGQKRVFLNLCAGLDRVGVSYRVNDFRHARRNPGELVCIVGKPHLLDVRDWENPILFGSAVFSHPVDDPHLFSRRPVQRMLVPGEWCRAMFAEWYGDRVRAWPVGIDTESWGPAPSAAKNVDVLLYVKTLWDRDAREAEMITPIRAELARRRLRVETLRYGSYREEDYRALLDRSRVMIFLCEHETQGIAYQQALACGVPLLAWDRQGPWLDPAYYPRIMFTPTTGVPYWDQRCGETFRDVPEFTDSLDRLLSRFASGRYDPRGYVLERLTLERCAEEYLAHATAIMRGEVP